MIYCFLYLAVAIHILKNYMLIAPFRIRFAHLIAYAVLQNNILLFLKNSYNLKTCYNTN